LQIATEPVESEIMGRTDFSEMHCSVARTLEVIGDRWTLLILRDAFYGVRRFDDFHRDLGVARNILAARLAKLVEQEVLAKQQYEDHPARYEYRLTAKGRDLLPVLLTMMSWGDRWTWSADPPVDVIHVACGHATHPVLTCEHCGDELHLAELRVHPMTVPAAERAAG
jgi:DNA-binding HxlR family transcriptional regulator